MNQLHEVTTSEDYLAYFDQKLAPVFDQESGSLTQVYYHQLKGDFAEKVQQLYENPFSSMKKLLDLDAQHQLLVEWVTHPAFQDLEYTEEEVIKAIQTDKASYYRELAGMTKIQTPPWGLMYLSDWNEPIVID